MAVTIVAFARFGPFRTRSAGEPKARYANKSGIRHNASRRNVAACRATK
jgi:hypothetical protein